MDWSLSNSGPIWQQLAEQLTLGILRGEYPPGCRLPGVRELAAQAGVNPNTMQRALAALEQSGLAVANRTAGRTVTENGDVIAAARRGRAKAAVAGCLGVLKGLGYSQEEAIRFIKEDAEHE